MALSHTFTPRDEYLTANNTTFYISANADLRSDPVVLEIPPASNKGVLYGQVVDAWQETIADVGPAGVDKGKGGKILFLPPGHNEAVLSGYIGVPSGSFRIQFAFRSIKLPGMTDADAYAYAHTLKMYPLSEAANPRPIQRSSSSLPHAITLSRDGAPRNTTAGRPTRLSRRRTSAQAFWSFTLYDNQTLHLSVRRSSTRRFKARPCRVALSPFGFSAPKPAVCRRSVPMPRFTNAVFTAAARSAESF
jgi:hypothetical protein